MIESRAETRQRRIAHKRGESRGEVLDRAHGITLEVPLRMRKTNKTKRTLNLDTETVRSLQESALADVAGGYNSDIICPRTVIYTCKVLTPSCPQ